MGELGGSGGTFLNIPGNIKQKNLPFVLDKNNKINTDAINVTNSGQSTDGKPAETAQGTTQVFSFKPETLADDASSEAAGFLRIAPGSFYNEDGGDLVSYTRPNNDISYKLLYNYTLKDKEEKGGKSINASGILNSLPSITIREYLQDSKLNNVINLFNSIIGGFDEGSKLAQQAKESSGKSFAKQLWTFATNIMKALPDILQESIKKVEVVTTKDFIGGSDESEKEYVMRIPYMLYYKMLSSTTINIFEIPYNGKILYQSNGTIGWNKDNGIGGLNTAGDSVAGQIFNYIGGNIKVNTTPTWTPADGNTPIKISVTFDLYNDTSDGAVKNFIFVNTIVPGNKFLQYHIYQHAPNLYDVRINGINRLFMCAANFNVESIGVLRQPSKEFLQTLVDYHLNNDFDIHSAAMLLDYIRIPDIYRITAEFESLLPDSFNNFIYQYYINQPIIKLEGDKLRSGSAYEQFSKAISQNVGKLWQESKEGKTYDSESKSFK